MPREVAETLLDLLAQEAAAIKQARYETLDRLQADIAAQVAALAERPPSSEYLEPIRDRLAANQSLLRSAMRGIAAARDRIAALEAVAQGFDTYDRAGARATMHTARPALERKA